MQPCLSHAATITYLHPEWSDQDRYPYGIALLKLAFAKAHVCHRIVMSVPMKQERAVLELQRGTGKVDIMITMTSHEREAALRAVPVPLTKGLLGWRIALLNASKAQQFAGVRTVGDLWRFVAGQGRDWPDADVLEANGLAVYRAPYYPGLFGMLEAGRIDYFPRGIQQIFDEQASHPRLAIDPYVVLRYRTDAFFFVNKKNTHLAEEVRRGLEAAIADGSFDRVFYAYFARQIDAAHLERRRVLKLDGAPPLVAALRDRPAYWFSPDETGRKAFRDALAQGGKAPAVQTHCAGQD